MNKQLNLQCSGTKAENEQLRKDIQTLLDFKNELESLAEDQNSKIESMNQVSSKPLKTLIFISS